ncbi:MAG TPA: cupredoxin domain-containing protein [Thermomicrobiales bacterium]|nr:cupredoxin domain-containing protein [Thermomicrobiales bacterium]
MSQRTFDRRKLLGAGVIVGATGTALGFRAVLANYHEDEEEATETVSIETQAVGSTPAAATPGASPEVAGMVQVELTEFEIRMPRELPAGQTTFEVTNVGSIEHNFEVEGQGIEREFEQNLQPSETKTMTVDLEPGTYEVYCPVGNHAEQGMRLELTVTD